MSSPLGIILDQPSGRTGLYLSLLGALARAVSLVLIAEAVARTITGAGEWRLWAALALIGAILKGASLWFDHSLGTRMAADCDSQLRGSILSTQLRSRGRVRAETAVSATRGIDDLDDYFTTVLPALTSTAVIPTVLLIRIVFSDPLSAVIIVLCLPLVPVFMILIGKYTHDSTKHTNDALARLSNHLAELAEGLPVLIGLGQSKAHAASLARINEDYHRSSLSTLRIAFLSSLALELITTISVALVAVVIGLRLVSGNMDLTTGLLALLLAPECFLPLRQLGAGFHASENGREAHRRATEVIRLASVDEAGDLENPLAVEAEALDSTNHESVLYSTGTQVQWSGQIPKEPGITVVLGASGAGKSTVLSALTGNLPAGAVSAVMPINCAYVPQEPKTIAQTLGGELEYYGLDPAFHSDRLAQAGLPNDPQTAIGALSPGQLRRFAIVRALIRVDAGAEVLVLDEPTAHLDETNADLVRHLIATAASHIRVITAGHDSTIVAMADHTLTPHVGRTHLDTAERNESASPAADDNVRDDSKRYGGSSHDSDSTRDDHSTPVDKVTPARNRSTRASHHDRGARARLHHVLDIFPIVNRDMFVALAAACASSLAGIALTAVSAWLIVTAAGGPPIMTLLVSIVGVRFFGLGRSVLGYLSRLRLHSAVFGALTRLRLSLWSHFESVGMSDRKLLRSDSALSSIVADADEVRDLIPRTLFPPVVSLLVTAAVAVTVAAIDLRGLPVVLVLAVLNLVVLPMILVRREMSLARSSHSSKERILSLLSSALEAKVDLRTNGVMQPVESELQAVEAELAGVQRRSSRNFGLAGVVIQMSTIGAAMLIVQLAEVPTSSLAVLVLMTLGLGEIFSSGLGAWRQWPELRVVLDRLPTMSAALPETTETGTTEPETTETIERGKQAEALVDVRLRNITVGWDEVAVLDNFNLEAQRGRWTVLRGDSGSGKSSAMSVVLRFIDPWSGSYSAHTDTGFVRDVLESPRGSLAGQVAWCPQEAHIFRSTIRGNLAIARTPTPSESEMCSALRQAGLSEWADRAGLDRWAGDHGGGISGGQRQRLAVARTLLSEAGVIILDEPTAHLDVETAHEMMRRLRENLGDRAVILLTHDESLIEPGDRVINLGDREGSLI